MADKKQLDTRKNYKVFVPMTTRWMDNDVYGHMNNVVHYSLFDTAVNSWLIKEGVLDIYNGEQVGLVVETGCKYYAEMAFPDVITAGIRVSKIGSSSVVYEVGLFKNDETTVSAQGFFVHVYVQKENHKPSPLNDALKNVLKQIAV